jgi:hypothetical protein
VTATTAPECSIATADQSIQPDTTEHSDEKRSRITITAPCIIRQTNSSEQCSKMLADKYPDSIAIDDRGERGQAQSTQRNRLVRTFGGAFL